MGINSTETRIVIDGRLGANMGGCARALTALKSVLSWEAVWEPIWEGVQGP